MQFWPAGDAGDETEGATWCVCVCVAPARRRENARCAPPAEGVLYVMESGCGSDGMYTLSYLPPQAAVLRLSA